MDIMSAWFGHVWDNRSCQILFVDVFFLTRLTNTYVTSENFLWLSIAVVMNLLYGWGVCYSGAAITLAYNRRLIDN